MNANLGPGEQRPPLGPAALLVRQGAAFHPTELARGYWSPDTLNGGVIAGLIGRVLECDFAEPSLQFARLTVDLFRQTPLQALSVSSALVRDGNRLRVVEATVRCGDLEVARGHGVLLRRGEDPPGEFWGPATSRIPPLDSLDGASPLADTPVWETTRAGASPPPALTAATPNEQKWFWLRLVTPLVAGEETSPFTQVALLADLTNPLANGGSEGVGFVNADITLYLHRQPVSQWLGIEVASHHYADGIAVGEASLHDTEGPIGTSIVSALTNQRRTSSSFGR